MNSISYNAGITVRCKTCHYSLSGLTEHRCPECGNAFDPNDHTTFEDPVRIRKKKTRQELLVLSVLMLFLSWSAVTQAHHHFESGSYASMWAWVGAAVVSVSLIVPGVYVYVRDRRD